MRLKKAWMCLAAVLLLCLAPMLSGAEELRGYVKGDGYQYVQLGEYPYEADGSPAPVLWRILEVQDNQALLLMEYVIDTKQVIFETDKKVIEKRTYRRIKSYAESDLYTWLNTEGLEALFGNDPIRDALIEEPGGGKLFILNSKQFLTTDYGFSKDRWGDEPTRHAVGTPYAVKARGLYVDRSNQKSPYWVSSLKAEKGYMMQIVGYNGHLSWGAYTRQNVGLRLSVRLDLSQVKAESGSGTKEQPYVLASSVKASQPAIVAALCTATTEPAATPAPALETAAAQTAEAAVTPAATVVPTAAPTVTPEPTAVPTAVPTATPAPVAEEKSEALLSFLGDCSIGDSFQYRTYGSSYHKAIDEKGYAWPFSLVKEYLAADDLTVANLECVFTTRKNHSDRLYNLIAAPDHVQILHEGSIELVNTVNNHSMDFNRGGYQDSLDVLDAAGIEHFGSIYAKQKNGWDILNVQEINGIRIGFVGFTYPQQADHKNIAERIKILKEEKGCDLVVVSLHWGRETHKTPETGQMLYAKKVIDNGADMIWGHHAHVTQPIQFYKGKPILYSTGNFTFGTMSRVDPSTGIFQVTYEKVDGEVQLKKLQVIPCETQGTPDFRPYVLTDEAERRAVFKELVWWKSFKDMTNPPDSFLETGIIHFENGEMLP